MLGTDHSNFFFEQKRQKRFQQRRVRKFDEAGERRDGITFLIGDREGDAVSVGAPSLKLGISRRVPVPQPETASEEGGKEGGGGEGRREGSGAGGGREGY